MDSVTIRVAPGTINAEIAVPGSKSITNRALVLAALADGDSTLDNALFSDDSKVCVECLRGLGIAIEADEQAARIVVHGLGGAFPAKTASLFVGNSGTTARLDTATTSLTACRVCANALSGICSRHCERSVRTSPAPMTASR